MNITVIYPYKIMDLLTELLVCFTTFFVLLYAYFYFSYKYWEKRNFPFLEPKFPLGNSTTLIRKSKNFDLEVMKYYDDIKKRKLKFGGIFTVLRPALIVVDPDYIKDIILKDFYHFTDRGFYYNAKDDPISAHLFALDGREWKNMRTHLTPTFTSGKMKMMFPTVLQISEDMIRYINQTCIDQNEDLQMRECLAKYTTDVIGSIAFGIDANSFNNPNAAFRTLGRIMFQIKDFRHLLYNLIIANMPDLGRKLGLKGIREDVTELCAGLVKSTLKYREENNQNRPDFLQLLIDLKKEGTLTMDQLIAQVFVFFVAGSDTSTTAMNFALYELAKNQKIQERLRTEINDVLAKYDGKITYDNIKEIQYLQQVMDETLRLYPSVPYLQRVCVKDYKLTDTNLVIEKGIDVVMPIISIHRDADYYPDPETFDPERFTQERKTARPHFQYLPFGEGPRNCIGLRFGTMQSKIGLIQIVRNFRIKLSQRMKTGLTLDPAFFLLATKEDLYVTLEKI